jgi:hypothetical protein
MRYLLKVGVGMMLAAVAGCGNDVAGVGEVSEAPALRVINGFTTAVDVLVDGQVAISGLGAGQIGLAAAAAGAHTVVLRPAGSSASTPRAITTTNASVSTIAAVRAANGGVSSTVLDDTNSVVPAAKTKVRVLHLAPNAGTLQVYRTQPDYQTPISWQFPFTYQAEPTSVSAPFYQSDAGSWEIRVWQTPADASGWANAPVKVTIPLGSGDKKTVVILDKPGGGVRVELL